MPISGHLAGYDRASGQGATEPSHFALHVEARVRECRDRIDAAKARAGRDHNVVMVAVTKTHGVDAVAAAYRAGVHDVGENRIQEAESKMAACDLPVRWHLIGHLQRNKARAATRFALVHSVDSERLAVALDRAAQDEQRTLDVLVQVNISGETSKSGMAPAELPAFADRLHGCRGLRVLGAMTMAPLDADEAVLRTVFSGARRAGEQLAAAGHPSTILSMGMSDDFEIAVEEGATHVRLGTILFGHRS